MNVQNNKKRIFTLINIFKVETDDDNKLNTYELIDKLEANGVSVDRKTLKRDVEQLKSLGYDIIIEKSSPNRYFLGSRDFELAELQLLVNAVSSSRFITNKKSKKLIRKLSFLCSSAQRKRIHKNLITTNKIKQSNENIYYMVDQITNAIADEVNIEFRYLEYQLKSKKKYRNNGDNYTISPYNLYWNEDFYYVIGFSHKHNKVATFRLDRMEKVSLLETKCREKPYTYKVEDYAERVFQMYDGDEETVTLSCHEDLIKYVIDRFGQDFWWELDDHNNFTVKVPVDLSPTFYGWVCQFEGRVKIVGPDRAVNGFNDLIDKLRED